MRKKWQILLLIVLLSFTLNWLPEIANAQNDSAGVTYTTQTPSELMELFLTHSLQNPYIEIKKNSAELMFETEENATITITTNNHTEKITGSTTYHQFRITGLNPGNNLITITATTGDSSNSSKTITVNLPDKPKKDSKSIHHQTTNENITIRKKGHLL
ncbi:hypothetical protein [Listeria seeligeri]|uniref:hypothetical protein n=1 Tax=Listeria seeligeri TaxID=1640 RepID=UPI001623EEC4|nr:hypothetical protein [Listeria seeligeri]MBC1444134.1 hypothetical protein [Listeria seeligeri]MBC1541777.1 hypothetical protein [Listeria seeligeri]MBC1583612.1 hypothetical protein [Listeria seeligeri]MBC1773192.1 hypothetical protein [Listeria seeligeri]MBF2385527.1 hypothetical protein [Listeria seeligeri]